MRGCPLNNLYSNSLKKNFPITTEGWTIKSVEEQGLPCQSFSVDNPMHTSTALNNTKTPRQSCCPLQGSAMTTHHWHPARQGIAALRRRRRGQGPTPYRRSVWDISENQRFLCCLKGCQVHKASLVHGFQASFMKWFQTSVCVKPKL